MMSRIYILLPALLALSLAVAGPAQAAPITLTFDFAAPGGPFATIGQALYTDGLVGDTSGLANFLVVNLPTGYGLAGKVTVSQPTGDIAKLTVSSTTITSATGGTLRITASNPNVTSAYEGPAWLNGTATGSLVNSSISIQSGILGGAALFDLDNAGGPEPVTATGGGGVGSNFGPFTDTTAMSPLLLGQQITLMTVATISFQPGGAAALTDTFAVKSVPEPTTLLLMSSGLIGLTAAVRRRRNRRSGTAS